MAYDNRSTLYLNDYRRITHNTKNGNMEECSISRGEEYRRMHHMQGKQYRKIVHTFDAYRANIVWANESILPIVRLLIVDLSGLSFSGIFSLVTSVVSIHCSSLN